MNIFMSVFSGFYSGTNFQVLKYELTLLMWLPTHLTYACKLFFQVSIHIKDLNVQKERYSPSVTIILP